MFEKLRFEVEKKVGGKRKLIRKYIVDLKNKTQESIDIERDRQKRMKRHRVWKNHKLVYDKEENLLHKN